MLSEEEWKAHQDDVKRCRGIACYEALAECFGTESPDALERLIDGREPYGLDLDKSYSNKYRNWRKGKALPSDATITEVFKASEGKLKLETWRDLPLWELLCREPPPVHRLHEILEASPPRVRKVLYGEAFRGEEGEWHHHPPLERPQILALRDQETLEAMTALLCLSRKGEVMDDPPRHVLPAKCALEIFEKVILTHKPLFPCWDILLNCLSRIFWRREYLGSLSINFSTSSIETRLKNR